MKILSIVLTSVLGLCIIQSVFGTERPSDTNKESSTALVENYQLHRKTPSFRSGI